MILAEDFWLRGKAAQSSLMQLWAYNTAFAGTATLQAWKMGLTAPTGFWQAMGRVGLSAVPGAESAPPSAAKPAAKPAGKSAPKKAPATPRAAREMAKSEPAATKPAAAPKTAKAKAKPVLVAVPKAAPKAVTEPQTKAKPKAKAAPAPASTPEPVLQQGPSPHLLDAPRGGKADDLTALKGVGAKLATSLNEFGIYHFDQLATLDDSGIDWLNDQQAGFKMLCARYGVVEQARARLA